MDMSTGSYFALKGEGEIQFRDFEFKGGDSHLEEADWMRYIKKK